MLLGKLNRMFRHVDRAGNDEGVALAAVLGLMAVGLLVSSIIMSSVITGLGQTTSTRAGVQAQAAAEAGAAAAFAGIQISGNCATNSAIYTSTTTPKYRATVWVPSASASGWSIGCPTGTGQTRIISAGTADAPGVAGNSSGNTAYVEKIYGAGTVPASGSAVYAANGMSANAFTVSPATTSGDVKMPSGNFNCSTSSTITGNVIVAAGSATMSNSCKITGSLKVSGSVTLSNTVSIGGDIVAAGGGVDLENTVSVGGSVYSNGLFKLFGTVSGNVETTGDADIESGGSVGGSLKAGGTLTTLSGYVAGNISSAGTGASTIFPSANRVGGNIAVGGNIMSWNNDQNKPYVGAPANASYAYYFTSNHYVGGTFTYQQAGLVVPTAQPAPTVPAWTDWTYTKADWTSAGFTEIVWPSSLGCTIDNNAGTTAGSSLYPFWQSIQNLTTPTVINALGCSQINFCNCTTINFKFKTDVAFISHSFLFGATTLSSGDGAAHKGWFLVPDGNPGNGADDCTGQAGGIQSYQGSTVQSPLAVMLYTPCDIQISNQTAWRGQFYSRTVTVSAGDGLTYVPLGIPGTNLDGASANGTASGGIGALVSSRNRSNNGE